MPTTEIKLDFDPYDCTPGDAFDAFEERLLNNCTTTDDRGYSLADHLIWASTKAALPGSAVGATRGGVGQSAQMEL